MTTLIWIEPVLRPDGRPWYVAKCERIAKSGLLLRTRLGGPDGEILCDRVFNPVCESCRALMARGIVGPFETRKPEIDYPCMIGDIETAAGLTVKEPDDGVVHFARWRPFDQNALSRSPILAPARDRPDPGMEAAALLSGFGVIVDDALLRHASLLRRIKVMATRSKTS
jgi:hypothetical protein